MTTKEKYLKICLNLLVAAVVLFLILFAVPKLLVFFMPFVVGWIIATIANPLVRFFEKRLKIVRKHGTAIVIVLVLAVIVLISYGVIGKIVTEAMEFVKDFPTYVESIKADYTEISDNMNELIDKLPKGISKQVDSFTDGLGDIGAKLVKGISAPTFGALGQAASHVPSILIGIIFGFLASYFFIADRELIYGWIGKHIPEATKEKGIRAFGEVKSVVGGYFKAQFKIMFVVYIIVTIGLFILHVPFALLAGLGIAFLDMLPFFGTGTVLCPWALLKFLAGDHKMAIGLLIIYAVSQLVRQLIQPKLLGDSIGLNPFATLFFMYIGYQWGSVLGMIVAVPIAMIIINLSKAGVFDNFIYTIRLLVDDINTRRKYDK
ncbi:MAG: sporulation integral membrane protein YtvI [Lachnospiraceae bacterium]|nr:sporulation integral membrane protein YtvI [Lachnospiraceae bacterium]